MKQLIPLWVRTLQKDEAEDDDNDDDDDGKRLQPLIIAANNCNSNYSQTNK